MSRPDKVAAWMRPGLRVLEPYYKAPLDGDPLRLDQNTHLLGANPAVQAVDLTALAVDQYPTRDADDLLAALSELHGLPGDCFLAGNGSDELLDLVTRTFTEPGGRIVTTKPSYSLYPFYATLQDVDLVEVPLTSRFDLDVAGILDGDPDLVILASPNNPTGNRFSVSDIEEVVAGTDGVVLVDEAYIEYAGNEHSLLRHVESYDNLIVMRTMSKAYGLAGLRVGYLAANQDLRRALSVVKPPFNLNVFSEQVACNALRDQDWLERTVATIADERERLQECLKALGFKPYPTDANFILTRPPMDSEQLRNALLQGGILARTFPGKPGVDGCIRFTIGAAEHTDRLTQSLSKILEAAA